jgi:hypothetical protein
MPCCRRFPQQSANSGSKATAPWKAACIGRKTCFSTDDLAVKNLLFNADISKAY